MVLETSSGAHRVGDLFSYIEIEFLLSETGKTDQNMIFEVVGSYIKNLIKEGPSHEIYSELLQLNEIDFKYQSKKDEYSFICELTEKLDLEDKSKILRSNVISPFDENLISKFYGLLSLENMIVIQTGKNIEIIPNRKEKYFELEFEYKPIPENLIHSFNAGSFLDEVDLPPTNQFIAQKFDILDEKDMIIEKESDHLFTFYRAKQFEIPKSSIRIEIVFDKQKHIKNIENLLYFKIWAEYINSEISDIVEEARNASTYFSIEATDGSLIIRVNGLSDSIAKVITAVFERIKSLAPFDDQDSYEVGFSVQEIEILKFFTQEAHEIGGDLMSQILWRDGIDPIKKRDALKKINFEGFKGWFLEFYEGLFFEYCFSGNMRREECSEIVEIISSSFREIHEHEILSEDRIHKNETLIFPRNKNLIFYHEIEEPTQINSSISSNFQVKLDRDDAEEMSNLASQAMAEDFFAVLRTEEQLGYVCRLMFANLAGHYCIEMEVQGGDHNPNHYHERITAFLKTEFENLKKMDDQKFQEIKEATIVNMTNQPLSIKEAGNLFYARIVRKRRNMKMEELDEILRLKIQKIKMQEFLDFYEETFINEVSRIDVFCVSKNRINEFKEVLGKRELSDETIFTDIEEFKKEREYCEDKYHISKLKI